MIFCPECGRDCPVDTFVLLADAPQPLLVGRRPSPRVVVVPLRHKPCRTFVFQAQLRRAVLQSRADATSAT